MRSALIQRLRSKPFRAYSLAVRLEECRIVILVITGATALGLLLELSGKAHVLGHVDGAACRGVTIAPLVELEARLRSCSHVHARALAIGATTGYGTLGSIS